MQNDIKTPEKGWSTRRVTTVGASVDAYVPALLDPPPVVSGGRGIDRRLGDAMLALGSLNAAGRLLPDPGLFLYMYVRKEAVLSSQIEGTQASLADLLLHENAGSPGVPVDDVEEASSYVAALEWGLRQLREDGGLPLSMRLLRSMHGELLATSRGSERMPGEFRRSQNWIGGTSAAIARFVPPPPDMVPDLLGDLERYLHSDALPLLKAAVGHVQFETIHPFLDGNGRVGRMLVILTLVHERVLESPLLYLSLFLKEHRDEYYDLLMRVRFEGAWEDWILFFLRGVEETARNAALTSHTVSNLLSATRSKITSWPGAANKLKLFEYLVRRPLLTDVQRTAKAIGTTPVTVYRGIDALVEEGILRETSGARRGRIWIYGEYVDLLTAGTTT